MNDERLTKVRPSIVNELTRGVLLCDGAMGTQLFAAGLAPGECGEQWNLSRGDVIETIHRAYLDAGCRCITTNTFGGCGVALARHGLDGCTMAINRAAAMLARHVAGDNAYVLGNVGPTGAFLEPLGDLTRDAAVATFTEQVIALQDGGADAILIETMTDPAELTAAVTAARACCGLPVIVTGAFDRGDGQTCRTMMGATVGDVLHAASDAGADVVGANCGTAMTLDDYRRLVDHLLAAAGDLPVIMQPNAGAPQGRAYPATPQEMADLAVALAGAGVRMIGGCCGTTPAHLRAMADAIACEEGTTS